MSYSHNSNRRQITFGYSYSLSVIIINVPAATYIPHAQSHAVYVQEIDLIYVYS